MLIYCQEIKKKPKYIKTEGFDIYRKINDKKTHNNEIILTTKKIKRTYSNLIIIRTTCKKYIIYFC